MVDRRVLCAVDLGSLTARVLYHAAGFARTLGARLKIMHVAERRTSAETALAIEAAYYAAVGSDDPEFAVRTGSVDHRILEATMDSRVAMLVMGTHARGSVARLLLGSTSELVLRSVKVPVLLVPPGEMNIVTLAAGRTILITGPIVAAIDLGEFNSRQLHLASELAYAGGQPLLLLTVGENESDEHDLAVRLRHRAHDLEPVQPQAVIARTGEAAEEIARCAAAEHSGLVVMGLRDPGLGKPGAIAATVLHSGKTFVLAVPSTSSDDRINDLVRAPKRKAV